jgi:ribonucleoside-diphosphate reductase subunit M1
MIKERLILLAKGLKTEHIQFDSIVEKVVLGIHPGITTQELDTLAAETCAYMNLAHPHYSKLAARIAVANLHKETSEDFMEVAEALFNYVDKVGRKAPLLSDEVYEIIKNNIDQIQAALKYERDF